MKEIMVENGLLFIGIAVVLLISIGIQILIAYYMMQLVKESEQLEESNIKIIKLWIEEYIQEEKEIANIPVFVEKNIYKFQVGKFTLIQMKHFSGQLLLFVIFMAGVGVCKEIINGKTLGQILPFYIICFIGLYIHFLMSAFIDMEEKKKTIQRNVVDFLENKKAYLYREDKSQEQESIEEMKYVFGETEEKELKEILREILV